MSATKKNELKNMFNNPGDSSFNLFKKDSPNSGFNSDRSHKNIKSSVKFVKEDYLNNNIEYSFVIDAFED